MKILAFETSCDDTSVAIFDNDKLLAMDTKSQIKIHNGTWWVVPEVAAREHANVVFDVLQNVLDKTWISLQNIDYIAVTTNPWLLPSLLTWITVASSISQVLKIPIIPINHIEAHIFSNFLEREENQINFPLVCLTVSGWHNEIYLMNSMWELKRLWATNDDAWWEAFDKAAKMMWLAYPGWPIISNLAQKWKEKIWTDLHSKDIFPRVWLVKREHNFSFSGLKSAVKREVDLRIEKNKEILKDEKNIYFDELKSKFEKNEVLLTEDDKMEMSFEFENAITEVLSWKLVDAAKQNKIKTVMLAGWVSANSKLRDEIDKLAKKNNLEFIFPLKNIYCMDNAAMIGILAYYKIKYFKFEKQIWALKI